MAATWRQRLHLAPVRGWGVVPRAVVALLLLALGLQLLWYRTTPVPEPSGAALPPPPPAALLSGLALGERGAAAALTTLWLQFQDTRAGKSIPFAELDYGRLRAWLGRILALYPDTEYPLLLAVRIYAQVDDPGRQRLMLDFVAEAFAARPRERWRWLAEAVIIARHQLQDPQLALRYARRITELTRPGEIPFWARDLQIIVLEDLGELEAARLLIGGMLASGEIEDPRELRFLEQRLRELEAREGHSD